MRISAQLLNSLIVAGLCALFAIEYHNGERLARLEAQWEMLSKQITQNYAKIPARAGLAD